MLLSPEQSRIFTLLILAALVGSGSAGIQRARGAEAVYHDGKGAFTLKPPAGWKTKGFPDDPRSKVRFESPDGLASIGIIARAEEAKTLEETYAEKDDVAKDWRRQMPDGVFRVARSMLGNRQVVKVDVQLPTEHKQVIYFFMVGDRHFNLGYSAMSAAEFTTHEATALEALASLKPLTEQGEHTADQIDAGRVASAIRQIQILFNTDGVSAAEKAAGELYESAPDSPYAKQFREDLVRISRTPIAFLSGTPGRMRIYTARVDGAELQRLTSEQAMEDMPTFSPDGNRIAFRSERDGNQDIWVIGADGRNPVRLTDNPDKDSGPYWSPDGSRILYARKSHGSWGLWSMAKDGTDPREVLANVAGGAYSPNGKTLVFTRGRPLQIWTATCAGTDSLQLTTNSTAFCSSPVWTPDGKHIAYVRMTRSGCGIHIMSRDGRDARRLVNSPGNNGGRMSFSRDGKWFTFSSDRDGRMQIYLANVEGTMETRILESSTNRLTADLGPTAEESHP